jgi:hypothetical protein
VKRFSFPALIATAALIIGIAIGRYVFPVVKNAAAQKLFHQRLLCPPSLSQDQSAILMTFHQAQAPRLSFQKLKLH